MHVLALQDHRDNKYASRSGLTQHHWWKVGAMQQQCLAEPWRFDVGQS